MAAEQAKTTVKVARVRLKNSVVRGVDGMEEWVQICFLDSVV